MGSNNIDKLLRDLKNLPKQNAPENFEEILYNKIYYYENKLTSGESFSKRQFRIQYNPIFVPAFTIILVTVLIIYTIDKNENIILPMEEAVERAIPVIQETQVLPKLEPQKISVPKKRDFVVKRDRSKLNLGPGVSLDEREFSFTSEETDPPSFIDFPFPNEPITIRIPPPDVIFRSELEKLNNNKDSIRFINSRKR